MLRDKMLHALKMSDIMQSKTLIILRSSQNNIQTILTLKLRNFLSREGQ